MEQNNTKVNLRQFSPFKILHHWQLLNDCAEGKNVYPITGEIDPSNVCNHNCAWCMYSGLKEGEMLSKKIFFDLIDEFAELGVKGIILNGGGEPLANPVTTEAFSKIRKKGMEAALITNGGLLNEKNIPEIVDNCLFVRVSLDAATDKTHKALHNPNNPEKDNLKTILSNIKKMASLAEERKSQIEIGVGYVVSEENIEEIFEAAKRVKETGAQYIQIRPVYCEGKKISKENLDKIVKNIQRAMQFNDENFKVLPMLHRFNEVIDNGRSYSKCRAHCVTGIVCADANVYVCCQYKLNPKFKLGSLKEKTFKEIWESKERQEVINRIDLARCPPCKYNKYNEVIDYLTNKEGRHKNFL